MSHPRRRVHVMALRQQHHPTVANSAGDDRPYRDISLANLVQQIEFACSDDQVPDYYVLDELVRRAQLAENQR